MCIERENDNFKSREVNCLKECALALMSLDTDTCEGHSVFFVPDDFLGIDV